jgi:predicted acyl esterase
VTEGQVRLIHRRLSTSPLAGDPVPFRTYRRVDGQPLVPGEVTEIVFDLLPTSFVFRRGHAIRLAIAGVDAGHFEMPLETSPLVYGVHRDRLHPSGIELPVGGAARGEKHENTRIFLDTDVASGRIRDRLESRRVPRSLQNEPNQYFW